MRSFSKPRAKEGAGLGGINDDLTLFLDLRSCLTHAFSKNSQQILCQANQGSVGWIDEIRFHSRPLEAEPN